MRKSLWLSWVGALVGVACGEATPDVKEAGPVFKSSLEAKKDKEETNFPVALPANFMSTASGLEFAVEKQGFGPNPVKGQSVAVNYAGYFTDGRKFDSSKKGAPFKFKLGKGLVIDGWEEGLMLMNQGSRVWLRIPPKLAYGEQGDPPDIPPNATLIFYIELVKLYDLPAQP